MMDFITTYAEHIITAIIAVNVFLCARNNVWNWPIGLVAVTAYGSAAWFMWGLYADATLQIFYFATGLIGWWYWAKGKDGNAVPVTDYDTNQWLIMALAITAVTYAWGTYLDMKTDSVVPFLDAFTTITCMFAQIGLMLRKRGSWLLWIIADVFYVYMFAVKGLNLLAVEYAIFTLNAAYGYYTWNKSMKHVPV